MSNALFYNYFIDNGFGATVFYTNELNIKLGIK